MNSELAIETRSLTKRYRKRAALDGLDLEIPTGSVYAFLGHNGAGKTTTIRLLLNMLAASSGEALVLGKPSVHLKARDFESIGYVSENHPLPEWMSVQSLMRFLAPLYPRWDGDLEARLMERLRLPRKEKIKHLSCGMRMKVALAAALSFRPKLLIMDEPFSGLDPAVRDDLIAGLLELSEEADWTLFLSSHDVDEVERLASHVAVLHEGTLLLSEPIESLQERFRRVDLTLKDSQIHERPHWWLSKLANKRLQFIESAFHPEDTPRALAEAYPGAIASMERMSLREIYLALEQHAREEP